MALVFSISTAQHMFVQQNGFGRTFFNRTAGARRKRDKLKKGESTFWLDNSWTVPVLLIAVGFLLVRLMDVRQV